MTTVNILLMAPQQGGGNPLTQLLPIILIGVVFYFFMIRPQTKKMKDQKKFIEEIKKGDRIVTSSGIHGKIAEVGDTYFSIEVDNNVFLKIDKSAISLDASKALNS